MSLLVLSNSENLHVSTGRLVYSKAEIAALGDSLSQCEQLKKSCDEQQQHIESAINAGYGQGYEKGEAAGNEDALGYIAERLVTLGKQANSAREQVQGSSVNLAVQIVEKIASRIGPPEMIAALAQQAASELVPAEAIVVKVHPSMLSQVEEQLAGLGTQLNTPLQFESDVSLNEDGCILETEYGHVKADLETQLSVLRSQLGG